MKDVQTFQDGTLKGLLIKVPEDSSNYQIEAEYRPYSVWLHMTGRSLPMPIGNLIYPYKHDELKIAGTKNDKEGRWLVLVQKS